VQDFFDFQERVVLRLTRSASPAKAGFRVAAPRLILAVIPAKAGIQES